MTATTAAAAVVVAGAVLALPFAGYYTLPALLAVSAAWYLYSYTLAPYRAGITNLRGPESDGSVLELVVGKLMASFIGIPGKWHLEQFRTYGLTFRSRFVLGAQLLHTVDPGLIAYIYRNKDKFKRTHHSRHTLLAMLGEGLLVAEGESHTRQRRVLGRAFTPSALHGMLPTMYAKAHELADKMDRLADREPTVDVLMLLQEMTLDVIGLVGFSYDFEALKNGQDGNELAVAFARVVNGLEADAVFMLQGFVPVLESLPLPSKAWDACLYGKSVAEPIGRKLIAEKKKEAAALGDIDKGTDIGTDLLSLLIRVNMAHDLKPEHRLNDDEVLAQVTTFMFAGNETAATTLTWTLYALCQQPEIQDRLRAELLAVDTEEPEADQLIALPYLDCVVRESLRVHCPVLGTFRTSTEDQVLPLEVPVMGRDGKLTNAIPIKKGLDIWISANAFNLMEEQWGPDAAEFKPDRWAAVAGKSDEVTDTTGTGPAKMRVPGTYSNMLTFLGGPRICIGMRLALLEVKVALFVLLRGFQFALPPGGIEIESVPSVVIRPRVVGDTKMSLPLVVKPLPSA